MKFYQYKIRLRVASIWARAIMSPVIVTVSISLVPCNRVQPPTVSVASRQSRPTKTFSSLPTNTYQPNITSSLSLTLSLSLSGPVMSIPMTVRRRMIPDAWIRVLLRQGCLKDLFIPILMCNRAQDPAMYVFFLNSNATLTCFFIPRASYTDMMHTQVKTHGSWYS